MEAQFTLPRPLSSVPLRGGGNGRWGAPGGDTVSGKWSPGQLYVRALMKLFVSPWEICRRGFPSNPPLPPLRHAHNFTASAQFRWQIALLSGSCGQAAGRTTTHCFNLRHCPLVLPRLYIRALERFPGGFRWSRGRIVIAHFDSF